MGKGVGQIARQCRKLNIPCIALAGVLHGRLGVEPARPFTHTGALTELTSLQKAMAEPAPGPAPGPTRRRRNPSFLDRTCKSIATLNRALARGSCRSS